MYNLYKTHIKWQLALCRLFMSLPPFTTTSNPLKITLIHGKQGCQGQMIVLFTTLLMLASFILVFKTLLVEEKFLCIMYVVAFAMFTHTYCVCRNEKKISKILSFTSAISVHEVANMKYYQSGDRFFKFLCYIIMPVGVVLPLCITGMLVIKPCQLPFLTSITCISNFKIFSKEPNLLPLRVIFNVVNTAYQYIIMNSTIILLLHGVFFAVKYLFEITQTLDRKELSEAIKTYKQLQLLCIQYNEVYGNLLFIFLKWLNGFYVLSLFGLIRLAGKTSFFTTIQIFLFNTVVPIGMTLYYTYAGQVHESSKKLVQIWCKELFSNEAKQILRVFLPSEKVVAGCRVKNAQFQKFSWRRMGKQILNSLAPLKIKIAGPNFVDGKTILTLLNFVIHGAASLLLL